MSQPSDGEICIEQLFDAPPPLLFDAMTIPQHVRHWWGCLDDKHSVTVCAIDLRVGGAWRFVGRGLPVQGHTRHGAGEWHGTRCHDQLRSHGRTRDADVSSSAGSRLR